MSDLLVRHEGSLTGVRLTAVHQLAAGEFEVSYTADTGEWFMPDHQDAHSDGYLRATQIEGIGPYTVVDAAGCELVLGRLREWLQEDAELRLDTSLEAQHHVWTHVASGVRVVIELDPAVMDRV